MSVTYTIEYLQYPVNTTYNKTKNARGRIDESFFTKRPPYPLDHDLNLNFYILDLSISQTTLWW